MAECDSFSSAYLTVTASTFTGIISHRLLPAGATSVELIYKNVINGAGPHGPIAFVGAFRTAGGTLVSDIPEVDVASGQYAAPVYVVPLGATHWDIAATPGAVDNSNLAQVDGVVICAAPSGGTGGYCVYGTRLKSGVPAVVAMTPSVLLTIIGKFASSWKSIIASFFAGRLLDTADLCAQLPPPTPVITFTDILALTTYVAFGIHQESVDKLWTWIQSVAWPYFCECVPGSPDPVDPPTPQPPTGTTGPVYGPFPCDQSDQCAMLTQLLEQQEMLFGYLSMIRAELQALQSQATPFGYTLGTLHTGLTGNGEFAVSGILGLSVQFTTVPPDVSRREDDPVTYYSLGEIGLGTDEGWTRSVKCSHNPHLVLDIDASITRVSYSLTTGAVANIQELVRHV